MKIAESFERTQEYYEINIHGTEIILKSMHKTGVRNLIFASSAAVYGIPTTETLCETDSCNPINPYGETKFQAEELIKHYAKIFPLNYVIFRFLMYQEPIRVAY